MLWIFITAFASIASGALFMRLRTTGPSVPKKLSPPDPNDMMRRTLEACGFRVFSAHYRNNQPHFDGCLLHIGNRKFREPVAEMHGWRIAYQLTFHTPCCNGYYWWRLAQPYYQEIREPVGVDMVHVEVKSGDGRGPRFCAKCGRIERDFAGRSDGIGALIGSALNIFPVLDALSRRDDEQVDRARLALLTQERSRLVDRQAVVDLEIEHLRARVALPPGDGPYRAALTDPPSNDVKLLPAVGGKE